MVACARTLYSFSSVCAALAGGGAGSGAGARPPLGRPPPPDDDSSLYDLLCRLVCLLCRPRGGSGSLEPQQPMVAAFAVRVRALRGPLAAMDAASHSPGFHIPTRVHCAPLPPARAASASAVLAASRCQAVPWADCGSPACTLSLPGRLVHPRRSWLHRIPEAVLRTARLVLTAKCSARVGRAGKLVRGGGRVRGVSAASCLVLRRLVVLRLVESVAQRVQRHGGALSPTHQECKTETRFACGMTL